jgi:hypothetical protein
LELERPLREKLTESRDDLSPVELDRLVRLALVLARSPAISDPHGWFPLFIPLREALRDRITGDHDGDAVEEAFLELYCHLHLHEAPYSESERRRMDETGGYWNHAGGVSPLLRAGPHIHEDTVSCDLGAGNGLQGLLLQYLDPHARTVQVEISSEAVEIGRHLQAWLGIPEERVEWIVSDVMDFRVEGIDFLYLYRPVRPVGPGRTYYEQLAAELDRSEREMTIFSIADCLNSFLPPRFDVVYSDGHLTCIRGPVGTR